MSILGNSGVEATTNNWGADRDYGQFTWTGASGYYTGDMYVYLNAVAGSPNNKCVMGIFKASDYTKVGDTTELTGLAVGWNHVALQNPVLLFNGAAYWLVVHAPNGNTGRWNTTTGTHASYTAAYTGTLPDPIESVGTETGNPSIYADLTYSGSPPPTHTYDNKTNYPRANTAPAAFNHTVASGATVVVLSIITGGSTDRAGGSPTANSGAYTFTQADANRKAASSPETVAELWYLLSPPSGTLAISIPNTGTAKYLTCEAVSFIADSGYTTELRAATYATATGTNPTGPTHTSLALGDVIVANVGDGATTWNPSARTGVQLYDIDDSSYGDGAQYLIKINTANQALAWTQGSSEDWVIISAVFKLVASGQTFNEGVDLIAAGALSPDRNLTISTTLTLQAAGGLGYDSGGSIYNPSTILTALVALDSIVKTDFLASAILEAASALAASGGMSLENAVTLSAIAALISASTLSIPGSITLQTAATLASDNQAVLQAVYTLLANSGISPQARALLNGGLTLAAVAELIATGRVDFLTNVILSAASIINTVGELQEAGVFYEAVILAAGADLSPQALTILQSLITLTANGGLVPSSQALMEASMILLATASLGSVGEIPGAVELAEVFISILRRRRR